MPDDRFVSYAQNLEDVLLWRALGEAAGPAGFYIDVGAADPTALSVTRAFYERGWSGINVEPLPEQAERLRAARPRDVTVQAAAVARAAAGERAAFHRVLKDRQTGLSTLDAGQAEEHRADGAEVEATEVPVTTLAALCQAHVRGPVHFLKVDAEGAEAAVLAGADFAACRPWVVLVEATEPLAATGADLAWEQGLLAAGYAPVWFDGLNRFYLAEEHGDLGRHFHAPPNVFDRYTVYDAPLREHLAETMALGEQREQLIERLQTELARLRQQVERPPPAAPVVPPPAAAVMPPTGAPVVVPAGAPAVAPVAAPAVAPPAIDLPFAGTGVGRRLGLGLYRLVRPVARPMAWRGRQFLTGELRQELAGLRERLDQLVARPVVAAGGGPGPDPSLGAAIERALLTLALQDARDPAPPGLAPLPAGDHSPGEAAAPATLSNPPGAR